MDYISHYASPLGGMTMASDGEALTGLWFDGQRFFAETLSAEHQEKALPVFHETVCWLEDYFSGRVPDFTPAMRMRTTAFRKAVWEMLLHIPYGRTVTYGEIAGRMAGRTGRKQLSAQAVGGAVGHNAISLIIPCHRVLGADGSLTGYAGGTEKKALLLQLEREHSNTVTAPFSSFHGPGSMPVESFSFRSTRSASAPDRKRGEGKRESQL